MPPPWTPNGSSPALPPVRGLFQQRLAGDDALLRLARLRFTQAGMAAETYADTPDQLERVLRYLPPHPALPTVHLGRGVNLLDESGRGLVEQFAVQFAGRVSGLVVHDKAPMLSRTDDLVTGLRKLDATLADGANRPRVFVEYAAGNDVNWFLDVARRIEALPWVSVCVDIGHVGVRTARNAFSHWHPGLDLAGLTPVDPRLPEFVDDVQRAVSTALPAVLELVRSLGRLGKPVHFHLHDGHPLIAGLADHFSFLTQVPIPFDHNGRRSLDPMYGPLGLAEIVQTATEAVGAGNVSLTLEIHQAEGRLPLADAEELFGHWRDLTNAERTNYWLSVLSENNLLLASLRKVTAPPPEALG